ncbi:MAG: exo-alpha-sialidase [Lentisphaeria bacterium]|nr:exo-alpha-sialidase [Lentisphaeria bacterium]
MKLDANPRRPAGLLLALYGVLAGIAGDTSDLRIVLRTPVFVSGEDGCHSYRIPALLPTPGGALLAFCEGRRNSAADHGDIDVLVKRSEDGGRSWGEARVIWDDGGNTCGNPTAVADRDNGRLWLFLCHNPGAADGPSIRAGTLSARRTVWVTHSDDDGQTWEPARDVSPDVQSPDTRWDATGPGVGIQLRSGPAAGRLLVPAIGRDIVSDDHGATWRVGGVVPAGSSEAQLAELADGRLVRAGRPAIGKERRRFTLTYSSDQGLTWTPLRYHEELLTPVCQGSLMRHEPAGEPGRGFLLFSHPGSDRKRVRLTVRASHDGGETWPDAWVLHPGPAAYSCLAPLDGGDAGCLFECGDSYRYERIDFVRFRLERGAAP